MQRKSGGVSLLRLLLQITILNLAGRVVIGAKQFNRYDFPPGFIFGAGTSAYQVEGAAFEDGRKASILDTYAHSGRVPENGDRASDQYHKYKEDVELMAETRLDSYRFSISWARLIPDGRGSVNPKGLEYYNNLINELTNHGIQPHVTLLHGDLPQALEDEYGGFLNRKIVEDFTAYADVCFREFGDRVKYWATINEANIITIGGYDVGVAPPCRCSPPFGVNCTGGNSTTEPYLVGHNMLLAHASIAKLYREQYKTKQSGFLGFSLYVQHFVPATNASGDIVAARRGYDLFVGWLMHPLAHGDYPEQLKRNAGTRIPSFTKNESDLVKGSFDFIGINYYNIFPVQDNSGSLISEPRDFAADIGVAPLPYNVSGGDPSGGTLPNTPWGLQGVLEYFKEAYNNPPIHILENGQQTDYDNVSVHDPERVDFLRAHIVSLLDSVRNGSNAEAYFVWSFIDVYEYLSGYKHNFGLYHVDLSDPNLTRYPKLSQHWYSGYLKGANVTIDAVHNQAENLPTKLTIINSLLGDDEHVAAT